MKRKLFARQLLSLFLVSALLTGTLGSTGSAAEIGKEGAAEEAAQILSSAEEVQGIGLEEVLSAEETSEEKPAEEETEGAETEGAEIANAESAEDESAEGGFESGEFGADDPSGEDPFEDLIVFLETEDPATVGDPETSLLEDGILIQESESAELSASELGAAIPDMTGTTGNLSATVQGRLMYSTAFSILDLINEAREDAGYEPLVMDKALLEGAMMRSAETALCYGSQRPDGTYTYSMFPGMSVSESIAHGYSSTVFGAEFFHDFNTNGAANELGGRNESFRSAGIGVMKIGERNYWVALYSNTVSDAAALPEEYPDRNAGQVVHVSSSVKEPVLSLSAETLKVYESADVLVSWSNTAGNTQETVHTSAADAAVSISPSGAGILSLNDGKLTAQREGTCSVTLSYPGDDDGSMTKTITVKVSGIGEKPEEPGEGILAKGTMGDALSWAVSEDGTLTISGSGEIPSFMSIESQPWYSVRDDITSVVIQDGITSIGLSAFSQLYGLASVSMADSVTLIGTQAFYGCSALRELKLGSGVKTIAPNAFSESGIRTLDLSSANVNLDQHSLQYMPNLLEVNAAENNPFYKSVDGVLFSKDGTVLVKYPQARKGAYAVPEGTKELAGGAFYRCKITELTLPSSLEKIGECAIRENNYITSVDIPGSVKVIAWAAVLGNERLQTVTLHEGLEVIESSAFAINPRLTEVTLPSTVTSVASDAFNPYYTTVNADQVTAERFSDGSYHKVSEIRVSGTRKYDMAFQVLDLVNKERNAAGLSTLTMDKDMLEAAIQRAEETAVFWSHTRPSNTSCTTILDTITAENIAIGQSSASSVMNSWMNSPGHKANILTGSFTSIGIGAFQTADGRWLWVQNFGSSAADPASKPQDRQSDAAVKTAVRESSVFQLNMNADQTIAVDMDLYFSLSNASASKTASPLEKRNFTLVSSDLAVLQVNGNAVKGVGEGTATLTATLRSDPPVSVSANVKVVSKEEYQSYQSDGGDDPDDPWDDDDYKPSGRANVTGIIPLKKGQSTNKLKVVDITTDDFVWYWYSSNSRIASVNPLSGKIKAGKKTGICTVTAVMASGREIDFRIKVQKKKVKAKTITTSSKKVTLKKGQTFALKASVSPITCPDKITYKSSKKKIASVSKKGVIKAKKPGKSVVTVKCGKKKIKVKVKVLP